MTNFPKVAVVILNWNGIYYLKKFLPSIFNSSYPNLSIVIGDNGSTDDSLTFVQDNFPSIEIIQNDQNYGFAEGYNRVLEFVEADYYILLNSDVEVTEGWIEPVIAAMEKDSTVAAAQPKILSYTHPNTFEYAGAAGGYMDIYGYPFCRGRVFDCLEKDIGQYNDELSVFWASGAAFFIKTHAWKESGGFDNDFFAHMEEIDLCWRLKRMNYTIQYYPYSTVYHVGGGTLQKGNPFKTYLNFRNSLFMLQKNLPSRQLYWRIFIRFCLDLIALFRFYLLGQFKDAFAIHKAHWHFIQSIPSGNKKRKQLQLNYPVDKIYRKSIVWGFFVKKRKFFTQLKLNDFI